LAKKIEKGEDNNMRAKTEAGKTKATARAAGGGNFFINEEETQQSNKLFDKTASKMLLCLLGFCSILFSTTIAFGQQSTKNSPDQMLRSNGRVNPSSLGMEMSIPLGSYPARGINLPLSLSYSSKLWRFDQHSSVKLNNGTSNVYVIPRYSENAASGWTTSLSQPFIEYTGMYNLFDDYGRPLQEVYSQGQQTPPGENYIRRLTAHLPGGESHELIAQHDPIPVPTLGQGVPASAWEGTFYATDGSGIKYVQDSANQVFRLWMPDGSFYTFNSGAPESKTSTDPTPVRRANKLTDAHGNYAQFYAATTAYPNGYWKDTLGREFPVMMPRETPSMPSNTEVWEQSFTLPGMSEPYVLRWKRLEGSSAATSAFTPDQNYQLKYAGHTSSGPNPTTYGPTLFYYPWQMSPCSGDRLKVLEWAGVKFNPVVLSEIELPNGAKYKFTYNEYGEIDRIHYPTGGYEAIQYGQVASLAELAAPYQMSNRGVTSRSIYEDGNDSIADPWTYTAESSKNNFRTSTIAPDGSRTDRFMHRGVPEPDCTQQNSTGQAQNYYGTRWGYDNVLSGMPYEERMFDSAGALKQRTITRWTASNTTEDMTLSPQRYVQINARTESTETIVYEGAASGLSSVATLEYDTDAADLGSPLNVVKTTQYAFKTSAWDSSISPGQSPPTNVSAPTLPTGLTAVKSVVTSYEKGSSYVARNILKLPTQVIVTDGQSTTAKAKTEIVYDETAHFLTDTTGGTVPGYGSLGTNIRGLATTTKNWYDIANNLYIETHTKYDQFGNMRKSGDGRGNYSEIQYTDNYTDNTNHYTFAFPTRTISYSGDNNTGTMFESFVKYNFNTGQAIYTTDANGQTSEMEYNDALLRPTKTIAPNGHETVTEYGVPDSNGQLPANQRFVKVKTQIDETKWKEGYTWIDGLGRTIKTQSLDSVSGDIFTLTCYDTMGRVLKATNPFRNFTNQTCSTTTGLDWTSTTYDAAGRVWKVVTPDGAEVETTYALTTTGNQIGTVVTVEDQAGKLRRSVTNALGQLKRVDEPNDSNQLGTIDSPNQYTSYDYDTLNNLITVNQGSQTRSFAYDSLSRLKEATNPESGTIKYTYDENGNLKTKRDARDIKTVYDYDALNRVTNRCYRALSQNSSLGMTTCASNSETAEPNTSDVNYFYDDTNVSYSKGKLTKVVTGNTSSPFSKTEYTEFDIMGRVKKSKQTTDGTAYNEMEYVYNLSGALIEEKYPSGRVVKNVLDNSGDLSIVQSKKNQNAGYWNYAQHFTYTATGTVSSMQLGNGSWESTQFNNRLQPTQIALGSTENATDKLKLDFTYNTPNNADNNGNLVSQTITVPTEVRNNTTYNGFTATQTYTYDSLNRIKDAKEMIGSTQQWKQTFTYDRYGNRSFDESGTSGNYLTTTLARGCSTSTYNPNGICDKQKVNPTFTAGNNRIVQDQDNDSQNDYLFDSSGNTTKDAGSNTFIYDGENKQVEVKNSSNQTIGQYWYDGDGKRVKKYVPSTGETTIFVYDASGKMVAEYSTIVETNDPKTSYLTTDHLGSPRINTDKNGIVTARHDYQPFGEEIQRASYGSDEVRKQFTSYERDEETELDYAINRQYSSCLGRFTQTDSYNIIFEKEKGENDQEKQDFLVEYISQPQNWNKYVYTINNPLKFIDPDGNKPVVIDVFINLDEGQESEEDKVMWAKLQAAAKEKGVTINIYRYTEKNSTADKFIESISSAGRITVVVGHSENLNALWFYNSNISAKDLDNKVAKASVIGIFTCNTGTTFNKLFAEKDTTLVQTDGGPDGLSSLRGNTLAGWHFTALLASGYDADFAKNYADTVYKVGGDRIDAQDSITSRKLNKYQPSSPNRQPKRKR
jgi:RHS repeat-associated protein